MWSLRAIVAASVLLGTTPPVLGSDVVLHPEMHATQIDKTLAFACGRHVYAFAWREHAPAGAVLTRMTIDARPAPARAQASFRAEVARAVFVYGFSLMSCTEDSAIFLLHGRTLTSASPTNEWSEALWLAKDGTVTIKQ